MNTEIKNIVTEVSQKVHDVFKSDLDKIILYGSFARGQEKLDSDVDILILLNKDKENLREYEPIIVDLSIGFMEKYEKYISLVLDSTKQYNRFLEYLPFYMNIKNEGILLYGRGEKSNI